MQIKIKYIKTRDKRLFMKATKIYERDTANSQNRQIDRVRDPQIFYALGISPYELVWSDHGPIPRNFRTPWGNNLKLN
jgi:hypothetical protein